MIKVTALVVVAAVDAGGATQRGRLLPASVRGEATGQLLRPLPRCKFLYWIFITEIFRCFLYFINVSSFVRY